MISFDQATDIIRSVAAPLGSERVPIGEAAGRVLAEPVIARIDSPRSNTSSMDGYTVRESDLVDFPVRLRVAGESFAGSRWHGELSAGECIRIFTGAPVPANADRIVIQEHVRREGDAAVIDRAPGTERYIRARGSDFQIGDELLGRGQLIDPRALVAAAAADVGSVEVWRVPRLSILATGDELSEPGTATGREDAIPDSVSLGIAALATQWSALPVRRRRLDDDLVSMQTAARQAVDESDLIVVTGGASVGERDFAKAMFEPLGPELLFSRLAIKPGKPAWLGRVRTTLIVGLPGNPTSALVTARLLLAPLLAGIRGQPIETALRWRRLELASDLQPCGSRETFHRAALKDGRAKILTNQDSGAQGTLASADLLVRQPPNSAALQAGTSVDAIDF